MSALSIQLLCCVTPETGFLDLQLASCPPSGVNKMGLFEGKNKIQLAGWLSSCSMDVDHVKCGSISLVWWFPTVVIALQS